MATPSTSPSALSLTQVLQRLAKTGYAAGSLAGVKVQPDAYQWLETYKTTEERRAAVAATLAPTNPDDSYFTPGPVTAPTETAAPFDPTDGGEDPTDPRSYFDFSPGGARPLLASSPEWLAYLNAQGLEENQFRASIDRQRAAVQSEIERQAQGVGPAYQEQRRGITGNLESRGMARSGELLRRLAESRAQEGQTRSNIQATGVQNLQSLEEQLAGKLIDLSARKADRELELRASGYR